MEELFDLIGDSLSFGFKLYNANEIKEDTLCLLAIQRDSGRKKLTFESDDNSNAHQYATDYLRSLEEKNDVFRIATLTYDGYITVEGYKKEALITQVFTLESYANRRFYQIYSRRNGAIELEGSPIALGEWDYDIKKAEKLVLGHMQKSNALH